VAVKGICWLVVIVVKSVNWAAKDEELISEEISVGVG